MYSSGTSRKRSLACRHSWHFLDSQFANTNLNKTNLHFHPKNLASRLSLFFLYFVLHMGKSRGSGVRIHQGLSTRSTVYWLHDLGQVLNSVGLSFLICKTWFVRSNSVNQEGPQCHAQCMTAGIILIIVTIPRLVEMSRRQAAVPREFLWSREEPG